MCFTFLHAMGFSIGASLKEDDWVKQALDLIQKAKECGTKLLLPVDFVIADTVSDEPVKPAAAAGQAYLDMLNAGESTVAAATAVIEAPKRGRKAGTKVAAAAKPRRGRKPRAGGDSLKEL
jgi:3-phosphoglycerate kinase